MNRAFLTRGQGTAEPRQENELRQETKKQHDRRGVKVTMTHPLCAAAALGQSHVCSRKMLEFGERLLYIYIYIDDIHLCGMYPIVPLDALMLGQISKCSETGWTLGQLGTW